MSTINLHIYTHISNKLRQLEQEKDTNISRKENFNITALQSQLLSQIVFLHNPTHILEFGTSNGYSMLSIMKEISKLKEFEHKTFTTIEINNSQYEKAVENLKSIERFNSNINLIHGDVLSDEIHNKIFNKIYDFVFVDCNQSEYEKVLNILISKNLIQKGSIIIFENILSHNSSNEFYTKMKEKYDTKLFGIHNGFLQIKII